MINMKVIGLVVGLIVMSPIIVLNVWGAKMSFWVNDTMEHGEAVRAGSATYEDAPKMPGSPLDWFRDRAQMARAFSPDEFNKERKVLVRVNLDFQDLLADGEAVPDDVFIPVYAEARAPRYMVRFCPEVLATIGTSCTVGSSSASVGKDGSLSLSAHLHYVPKYEMGTPEKTEGSGLVFGSVGLASHEVRDLPESRSAARKRYMDQAETICDTLRAEYGTCIISNLDIGERALTPTAAAESTIEGDSIEFRATVLVLVYGPDTDDGHLALRARLKELVDL